MAEIPVTKVNVSIRIFDFGHLEAHDILGREEITPQLVEGSQPQYSFPDATAPCDPAIVFPLVTFI